MREPGQLPAPTTPFYITGGTMPRNALSYVERDADRELYEAISSGQFCYVLTSRQMGKSSLMVRTAARLRKEEYAVAVLDLTAVGQNLSAEQWYDGLLNLLARSLDLEEELEAFWLQNRRLGPLQRWMQALHDVVMDRIPGRIVLFLEEIDAVRSLPFSVDEFFAAIRECYNRRTEDPEYGRLTFCMLGVATPADLIRDTRITPFNIGRQISLTDFRREEMEPLSEGFLAEGGSLPVKSGLETRSILNRVFYWTQGHPYLTQRLCRAVADRLRSDTAYPRSSAELVDQLCNDLFLSPTAREQEENLIFVRERLLRNGADLASVLTLYQRILEGRSVEDDEVNPLVSVLRLSGAVRSEKRRLLVRNPIYAHVFDRAWVRENLPNAERRRLESAYRAGVLRTAGFAATLFLGFVGWSQWNAMQVKSVKPTPIPVPTPNRQVALSGNRTPRPQTTPVPRPTPSSPPTPKMAPSPAPTPTPKVPPGTPKPKTSPTPVATTKPIEPVNPTIPGDLFPHDGPKHGWNLEVDEGSGARAEMTARANDIIRIDVQSMDTYEGNIRALAPLPKLKPNMRYVLSLEARASQEREITVRMQHNRDPWEELGLFDRPQLTTRWQKYRWEFTTPPYTEQGIGSIVLGLAQETGSIDVRNVHLLAVEETVPAAND